MALQSTISTAPGTLIIAPARQETAAQTGNRKTLQQDAQQQGQRTAQPEIILRRGNSESFANAESFRAEKSANTAAGNREHSGIEAYQSLAFEARKDEIKQMMGVDTYA